MSLSERSVEVPWVRDSVTHFPVLDVGCVESTYHEMLNGPVDGLDVRPITSTVLRNTYQADIRTWQAPELYPTVLAVSSLEHVGLDCRSYGTEADDPNGDRHAVEGCMRALAPDGVMLLTVPFGERSDHGWYRRYDMPRLQSLLDGYDITVTTHLNPEWAVGGVALVEVRHP